MNGRERFQGALTFEREGLKLVARRTANLASIGLRGKENIAAGAAVSAVQIWNFVRRCGIEIW
jgi:uncharacterized membrane protein